MGNVLSCINGAVSQPVATGFHSAQEERESFADDGLIWRSGLGALHAMPSVFIDASDLLRDLPHEFSAHNHGYRLALRKNSTALEQVTRAIAQFSPEDLSADALRQMMLTGARRELLPALGVLLKYRLLDFSLKHEHDGHCGSGVFGHRHCSLIHIMALKGQEAKDLNTQSTLQERFNLLAHSRVNLDVPCAKGDTPLIWAVRWGSCEAAHALIHAGAAVEHYDSEGRTALHHAAEQGKAEAVSLLIEHGHHPDLRTHHGHRSTALHLATEKGHCHSIATLARWRANMDALDAHYQSPLLLAVRGDHTHSLKALVRAGADINARHGPNLYSALHWATREDSIEMVRALIERGADVNIRARDGSTPLHFVGLNHNESGYSVQDMKDIADLLLAEGARIDAFDRAGATPVDVAATQGNEFLYNHLLKRGATPRRPLDLAANNP